MFRHIVFFKIKQDLTQEEKSEATAKILDLLATLPGKLPVIKTFKLAKNVSDSERAFDIYLEAGFDTQNDYIQYRDDSYHRQVVEQIKVYIEKSAVVDYAEEYFSFEK